MHTIIDLAKLILVAVVAVKLIYLIVPYRRWRAKKPIFVLFPKYLAEFSGTYDDLVNSLKKHGFEESNEATYVRGHMLGDFSAKALRLKVVTDKTNHRFTVAASFWGLFLIPAIYGKLHQTSQIARQ